MAKLAEQQAKTEAQIERNAIQLAETKRILSGVGINLGDAAEDFFVHSLQEKKVLGNISFDAISSQLKGHRGKVKDEFDLGMYNADSVAIIEVKHKVHPSDLDNLLERKLPNFKALFPRFADAAIYLGIAGMSIPPAVAQKAEKAGVVVLRQAGQVLVMNTNLRAF